MLRVLLLISVLVLPGLLRAETLEFTELEYIADFGDPRQQLWYRMLEEASATLGYDFRVRFEPGKRAFHEAMAGQSDGMVFQAGWLKDDMPSLVRVEHRLAVVPVFLYQRSAESGKSICDYRIGIPNGFSGLLPRIDSALDCNGNFPKALEEAVNFRRLAMMLKGNRLDGLLAPVVVEDDLVKLVGTELHALKTSRFDVPVYMYLSKKHAALAQPMAQAIKAAMEKRGIDNRTYTYLMSEPSASISDR